MQVGVEERREQAFALRRAGLSFSQIGVQLGVPKTTAYRDVVTLLQRLVKRQALAVEEYRRMELERLDDLERAARRVLTTRHVAVNNGQVVRIPVEGIPAGQPRQFEVMQDDGPILAAIDRLVRVAERRARLLGLDMPTKIDANVTDWTKVTSVDTDALAAKMVRLVESQAEHLAQAPPGEDHG
jgi:hypothetical protein